MRKSASFRFDPDLLEQARQSAKADNRSLTNFVETALRRAIEHCAAQQPASDRSAS